VILVFLYVDMVKFLNYTSILNLSAYNSITWLHQCLKWAFSCVVAIAKSNFKH